MIPIKRNFKELEKADLFPYVDELTEGVNHAWKTGLLTAWNGNASIQLPKPYSQYILITGTKTYKGNLKRKDISVIEKDGTKIHGPQISSETGLHTTLYETLNCKAILHTHPSNILAFSLKYQITDLLTLPLFETRLWKKPFIVVEAQQPGSKELNDKVREQIVKLRRIEERKEGSIWLSEHGLVAWGESIWDAVAISEELEHLAKIAMLVKS